MSTADHRTFHSLEITCLLAALALGAACGDEKAPTEKKEPAAAAPTRSPHGDADPSATVRAGGKKDQASAQSDPLLGNWIVVKAEGTYAEQNTGIAWSFEPNGMAISISHLPPGVEGRAAAMEQTPAGDAKEVRWKWKRVGPDLIDLSHTASGSVASIRHRMEGEQLVLDWNNGGQILFLDRQK